MYGFLRKIPMFADLTDDDLNELCLLVSEQHLKAGDLLFPEGSAGDCAYVIQSGEVEIVKSSGNREVLLAVRGRGEVIGEMALLEDAPRMASVRARTDASFITIGRKQFDDLLATSPSVARAMLHTTTARLRVTETMLRQSEKLGQLGTLSAGVAHELNNPSAAVQRGVGQLRDAIRQLQHLFLHPSGVLLDEQQLHVLRGYEAAILSGTLQPISVDPLMCSDLEYELETWFSDHGIDNGWEYASTCVNIGFDTSSMDNLASHFDGAQLTYAIRWLAATHTIYTLLDSVGRGATHISDIVKSLKTYVYLDQAPVQSVDINEGLKNTLSVMQGKLKPGVTIQQLFAPNVPRIQAYGSELNQVWTNLLENAAYAVGDEGEIDIRTRKKGEWVIVEIEDNGPGIPDDVLPKIFDPFFTTKPPGHGAGMGLTITYNTVVEKHRGDLKIFSRPGKTTVRVTLPFDFENVTQSVPTGEETRGVSDTDLLRILTSTRTIAVVGISAQKDRPSHTVPAYLQRAGYTIIPINAHEPEILGETAYKHLANVPHHVDVVLIFRPSSEVPPIVNDAIAIGARVVWMQEGIVHEGAAQIARDAGLEVVMDTCMRVQHQRLITQHMQRVELA